MKVLVYFLLLYGTVEIQILSVVSTLLIVNLIRLSCGLSRNWIFLFAGHDVCAAWRGWSTNSASG